MSERYNGALTREQFLFREMRIVAKLRLEGLSDEEIVNKVREQNLFQYPTEKLLKNKARACIRRLNAIIDVPPLTDILANGPTSEARLAALVAMMLASALLAEFMVSVIGEKYRTLDPTLSRKDLSLFFLRLQQQDAVVAGWSDTTVDKIKTVILNCLKETGYIKDAREGLLYPVSLPEEMIQAIRSAGLSAILPAFNVFV
jgi:hypothetical protein